MSRILQPFNRMKRQIVLDIEANTQGFNVLATCKTPMPYPVVVAALAAAISQFTNEFMRQAVGQPAPPSVSGTEECVDRTAEDASDDKS